MDSQENRCLLLIFPAEIIQLIAMCFEDPISLLNLKLTCRQMYTYLTDPKFEKDLFPKFESYFIKNIKRRSKGYCDEIRNSDVILKCQNHGFIRIIDSNNWHSVPSGILGDKKIFRAIRGVLESYCIKLYLYNMHNFTKLSFLGFLIMCKVFDLPDFYDEPYHFFTDVKICTRYLFQKLSSEIGISQSKISSNVNREISPEKICTIMDLFYDNYYCEELPYGGFMGEIHCKYCLKQCTIDCSVRIPINHGLTFNVKWTFTSENVGMSWDYNREESSKDVDV